MWVTYKPLSLNRAVTGIAVSCNGSSVFTTSQGEFSCLNSGLPGTTKNAGFLVLSQGLHLGVLSPQQVTFEQFVAFCRKCHCSLPETIMRLHCWQDFQKFQGQGGHKELTPSSLLGGRPQNSRAAAECSRGVPGHCAWEHGQVHLCC